MFFQEKSIKSSFKKKASKSLKLQNYETHRMDKTTRGEGTALLVKDGINHQKCPQSSKGLQEPTGVRVTILEEESDSYSE